MSHRITVVGANRATLMENTRKALEGFQKGRPVNRDALVRQAMATVLGQNNEHLPTAQFADDNPTIEGRITHILSSLDFLQDWGTGDDEYIDRVFEARAWDPKAEEEDITVDYRLTFHVVDKSAYLIVGKNYGSGMNENIEINLAHIPLLPLLDLPELHKAPWVDPAEAFAGAEKMMALYQAVSADPLLQEVFLETAPAPTLKDGCASKDTETPTLSLPDYKVVLKALTEFIESRDKNMALRSELDVAAGAVSMLTLLGKQGEDYAQRLTFAAMTGGVSEKLQQDAMMYIVSEQSDNDGYVYHTLVRQYRFAERDAKGMTEEEYSNAHNDDAELEEYSSEQMQSMFAWNVLRNRPVLDSQRRLVSLQQ